MMRERKSNTLYAQINILICCTVGPDGNPIEVWRCLEEMGVRWLTNLFKKIWLIKKMPNEWKKSTLILLYKKKGDIQSWSNHHEIKLMYHTIKLWEKVDEHMLKQNVKISDNQFGFMSGRSTTKTIHLLRQLIKRFREEEKFACGLYGFRKSLW